ncbi:Hermansky-Pudlak syndrome 4 protein [Zootermopsis nevadensis]|uniref:Hermansky-Pudlak syndrome 4 protein n=1 Tax=Zootermopsis nevadensis TaxID=136037 RepID=A0A067QU72_ZOONE|nr:Hermansky-Pudlak syndrome 4 protein [Zootermopsis nevadensis]
MAKELFIVFVYDTQRCQREEDDPQEAVLYFHPGWVNDQQRLALCGQLMGATQFFLTSFSCPNIISLNSGKFVIRQFGRYILTTGTDQNIPDWVLVHRADTLNHLIQFYHKDLETVSSVIGPGMNQFSNKLNQIFETYIPILPYAANIFGNIPTVRLPKSASNIFLEALQILQCCREKNGVLGGAVLFQNKVVASQLSSALTKRLICSDPCRIKLPAESVSTPFHLPVGVQLLHVYVESKEFYNLQQNSASVRSAFENVASRKSAQEKVPSGKVPLPKEPLSAMKRDISRIFTVPEEREGEVDQAEDLTVPSENESVAVSASLSDNDMVALASSMCSTPLKDINLNKVLHGKALSICSKNSGDEAEALTVTANDKADFVVSGKVQGVMNLETRQTEKPKKKRPKPPNFLVNFCESEVRSLSLNDLQQHPRMSSNRVPMKYYSFGLPRITRDMTDDSGDCSPMKNLPSGTHFYNTISDPLHPLFRYDGLPISCSLYNENLARHYQLLDMERSDEPSPGGITSGISFTNLVSSTKTNCNNKIKECDTASNTALNIKKNCDKSTTDQTEPCSNEDELVTQQQTRQVRMTSSKQEVYRRSLSLPLKSMITSEYADGDVRERSTSYTAGVLESPAVKTRTLELPITPLMSKLSSLAIEERTSGFCSRDTSPGEFRDLSFPGTSDTSSVPEFTKRKVIGEKREAELEQEDSNECAEAPKNAVLYLCGQQNMSLLLLLEEGLGQDPDLIHCLWETSVNSLARLETHLRQCLDHFPQGEGLESYSFLILDPSWDMIQRGGIWASTDLEVVACLHNDFIQSPNLSEVIVRCEDSTVYGYQCGKMEVFYQQSAGSTVGLPMPSDLMGLVPLKAKRRLERDHSIVLL